MKTLKESLLNGMEDTLDRGNIDVSAALSDMIIKGITSNDAKEQEKACKAFVDILKDDNIEQITSYKEFNVDPYKWYVQFRKDRKFNWYDFVMIRKIGGYFYIVNIDEFGHKPVYDRQSTVKAAVNYISPRDSVIYKISDNMKDLDKICDKILRIMYAR